MNARNVLAAAIGVVVGAMVPMAYGQSSAGGAPPPAAAAGTAATTKPGAAHHKHDAAHHSSRAMRHHPAQASAAAMRDGEYHAALRSCVSGPSAQRDSCLDDAIARHGRS
jgi:hypothetical protein